MSRSVTPHPKSHCPWDGLDSLGTSQSIQCSMPYPYRPSHPNVPWDGLDRMGMCQERPMQYALFHGKAGDGNGTGKKKKKGSTAVA